MSRLSHKKHAKPWTEHFLPAIEFPLTIHKVQPSTYLPKELWEEAEVPNILCSVFKGWGCWWWGAVVDETKDWDSDCERELSGEVERDDDECKDEERTREPGILTGAELPSNLWPMYTLGGEKKIIPKQYTALCKYFSEKCIKCKLNYIYKYLPLKKKPLFISYCKNFFLKWTLESSFPSAWKENL